MQMRFDGPVVSPQLVGHVLGPNRRLAVKHLPNRLSHLLRFAQKPFQIRFGELKHIPHRSARSPKRGEGSKRGFGIHAELNCQGFLDN